MKKISFETFRQLGGYEKYSISQDEPSCFNGMVNVVKWRVTFEPVDEPRELIHERIQRLWDNSKNHHDGPPLQAVAAQYGYELQGSRGSNRD